MNRKNGIFWILIIIVFYIVWIYGNKQSLMVNDSITPVQRFTFFIVNVLIFSPLPYIAFRKKRYIISFIFAAGSLLAISLSILDPINSNESRFEHAHRFDGIVWMFAVMFIVFPIYIIGFFSWMCSEEES